MSAPRRDRSRGQGLVEFAMLVPVFCLFLFGMLEFGFVFSHNLTIEYATREGARAGAALADGGKNAAVCSTIDAQIIAAVERVLNSPGSPIVTHLDDVTIKLWKSNTVTGQPNSAGDTATWTYLAGGGPVVDGKALDYKQTTAITSGWTPCNRVSAPNPQSIGVSLTYTYHMITPLSAIGRFFGGSGTQTTIPMTDQTVMALNP